MDGPTTLAERQTLDDVLLHGAIEVVGRVTDASNVALLVDVDGGPDAGGVRAMYKPVRGERPLWDFPDGTLAGRETASALIAEATEYAVVPPTVLREGPLGLGSVQLWIGDPYAAEPVGADRQPVRLVPVGSVPPGWLAVIDGRLPDGREVTVVHEDAPDLRDAAVLDAILNNSDRKGGHLVRDSRRTLWGFDHGLTLHAEPKLRTVLWGWAGQPLRPHDVQRLSQLAERLDEPGDPLVGALADLLPRSDVGALGQRVRRLAVGGIHPLPHPGWPSIPWPAL